MKSALILHRFYTKYGFECGKSKTEKITVLLVMFNNCLKKKKYVNGWYLKFWNSAQLSVKFSNLDFDFV